MEEAIIFCSRQWVVTLVCLVASSTLAAPQSLVAQTVTMPGDYADYAQHPTTGDMLALAAEEGQAVLFRGADLAAGKATPAAKTRVGASPCAVSYKRFGDKEVFAVICSQDSHMYLINPKDGALLSKIELAQSGVSYVAASTNSADPFIYYNYGGGHDSAAGVIGLRDMKNKGVAFDDSMDCAISASGEIAYRRGPWSPSGFESLLRTSDLSDDKPVFVRLFYDHDSTAQYIPDPFDRYTAAGKSIYSRSLERNEAGLDFSPQCFFKSRPVLIGIPFDHFAFGREKASINLYAASYNTFSTIGDVVTLDLGTAKDDGSLPRGAEGHADFKRVAKRMRFFADDAREQVVVANRDKVHFVSLAKFMLPREPFLLAELQGATKPIVGQDNVLTVKPMAEGLEISFDDLPEGMKATGTRLTWRPTLEQVGPAKIAVTPKHADIQRSLTFDVSATYPAVSLPFAPAGLAIRGDGTQAVIWEGAIADRFGRPSSQPSTPSVLRMALVDLATGKVVAERKLSEPVQNATLTDDFVVLLGGNGSPRCDVLRLTDLEREKALVAGAPIVRLEAAGKLLALQTQNGCELYDTTTFRRVGDAPQPQLGLPVRQTPSSIFNSQGVLLRGILFDLELKPRLVTQVEGLPALPGADARWQPSFIKAASPANVGSYRPDLGGNGSSRVATQSSVDGKTTIALDMRQQMKQVANAVHTSRQEIELALTASGGSDARQVIYRDERPQAMNESGQVVAPKLQLMGNEAFVAFDRRLFRWPIPRGTAPVAATPARVAFVPQQSAFALAGTGKTVLKHKAEGGKKPLKFALFTTYDSISIDEATGDVTIDEAKLLPEVQRAIEQTVGRSLRGASYVDALREQAVPMVAKATEILGRKPKGVPVAIPLRIDVSDAELTGDGLQYYVIAELPSAAVFESLRKLDAQRAQQVAERPQSQPTDKPIGAPDSGQLGDVERLSRRVDALEQRLDLITRQLNEVLKRID